MAVRLQERIAEAVVVAVPRTETGAAVWAERPRGRDQPACCMQTHSEWTGFW